MKIWILFDNPFDDGCNIYGAFSSKEKAKEAHTKRGWKWLEKFMS